METRTTFLPGMEPGILGTALIPLGAHEDSNCWAIVPGLVVSGIGQGIT